MGLTETLVTSDFSCLKTETDATSEAYIMDKFKYDTSFS
jgi:hypothetical protein